MNCMDLIKQRRSIRKFKDQPVPEAAIRNMIEAATFAPSASNRQPWRFIVVSDKAVLKSLADSVREAVTATAREVRPGFESGFLSYSRYFLVFDKAPLLILALYRTDSTIAAMVQENTESAVRMNVLEGNGAVISVSMAVQNMLLSAAGQGLGACVMTGPLIAVQAFNRILAVPDGWRILCGVCAGYPDEAPAAGRKKTVEQVVISRFGGADGV